MLFLSNMGLLMAYSMVSNLSRYGTLANYTKPSFSYFLNLVVSSSENSVGEITLMGLGSTPLTSVIPSTSWMHTKSPVLKLWGIVGSIDTTPGAAWVIALIWYGNGVSPSLSNTLKPSPKSKKAKHVNPRVNVHISP